MGIIAERVFNKKRFLLLNSYDTKDKAQYFAKIYRKGATVKGTRLARVVKSGELWFLWVCPLGVKDKGYL